MLKICITVLLLPLHKFDCGTPAIFILASALILVKNTPETHAAVYIEVSEIDLFVNDVRGKTLL